MAKKHLKRLAAPKSWPIARKQGKFTIKPLPSGHKAQFSLPMRTIIRDVLRYASNASQVNKILNNKEVLVDGKRVKNAKRSAGLWDIISFPQINENFKVIINARGKLELKKIDAKEAKQKLCKIIRKNPVKGGKIQLALHDGRTLFAEKKEYNMGDSLLITIPEQKINGHLKLEKHAYVYLTGGKHAGNEGTIEKVEKNKLLVKSEKGTFEAKKDFAFVVDKK